jgi:multidrug efflux pump subunit AcrA (membrane-fusion protein)
MSTSVERVSRLKRLLAGLAAAEAQEAEVELVRRHLARLQPLDLIGDRQAGRVGERAEEGQDHCDGEHARSQIGRLQRLHPAGALADQRDTAARP